MGWWKEQFQWKKLKFTYDNPEQIVLCQWQTDVYVPTGYLIFRMLFFTFYLGIWYAGLRMMHMSYMLNCLPKFNKGSILFYFTAWSIIFCCLASGSALLITTTQYVLEDTENPKKPVLECKTWFKLHLVLYTLALDLSLALAFGYFGYVHYNEKKVYNGISYVTHLWTGVLMLLDFVLSSIPTNLLHFYLSSAVCLLYGISSILYYVAGGRSYQGERYLYKILDWEDAPWTAVGAIIGSAFLLVAVRLAVVFVSRLRDTMFHKYYYNYSQDSVNARSFVVES